MATAIDFNPLEHDVQQNLYRYFEDLREEAPVYFIEALQTWGLFRYDDVAYTLKHPELFSARDFIASAWGEFDPVPEVPSIISLDPPEHTRLRKLANKAFLPSVIRAMQPKVEARINALLDEVQEKGGEFDFVSDFAAHVPVSVTAEILGVDPVTARKDFKRWTMDLLRAPSRSALTGGELDDMRTSVRELRAYFVEQIDYRRRKPGNDLVSALVQAEEQDQTLTEMEILSLVVLLQFGGAETPSHLISTTLWELFENPDAHAAVKAGDASVADAVEETLRHISPVHFIFQTATENVEFEHGTIPAESSVFAFIGSANRDHRAFDKPDRFDIARKSVNRHLSFATGAHFCIGAPLGRMMCSAAVESALSRMPNLHPTDPQIEWLPSFWVRGLQHYLVAP